MPHRLKHPANLTISTLRNGHAIPTIGTFATAIFNRTKVGHTVVKFDASQQHLFFFLT
jgi:hypothetical protein